MTSMRTKGAALFLAMSVAVPLHAQAVDPPYSIEELKFLIGSPMSEARVGQLVVEGCIEFAMNAFVISELREAGASLDLIGTLNDACVRREEVPVRPAVPIASVAVTPARSVLELGAQVRLSARVVAADGSGLTGRQIAWSSSDQGAARVTSDGLVQSRRPGLVVVSAETGGVMGQAQVRILPRTRSATGVFTTGLFVPGAGQFQVGRPARGALTLVGAAGAVAWGFMTKETTQFCASPVGAGSTCPAEDVLDESIGRPNLVVGVAAGAGLMLLSAIDAALHARGLNEQAERLRAQPFSDAGPALGFGPDGAVSASWRFHAR